METGGLMDNFYPLLLRSLPLLIRGAGMTIQVTVVAATISLSLGLIFGTLSSQRFKIFGLSRCIELVTFVYRAVPFFVQLLIVYFVIPDLFGWNFAPFQAAVLALGCCSAGYVSQIVRAGLDGISKAQWEAAFSLGYNSLQSLWYIIFPQMLRNVLPAFNNELDSLLKSTAIVSSIGMLELTRMGMNLVSREMEPVPIYLAVAAFYLCMSAALNLLMRSIERRVGYVVG